MFVDEARVLVASGKGGDGAVSFHREKYRPKGGPDGGNGGKGGSVILIADPGAGSLAYLKDHPHQKAKPGGNGARNNRTGADASDLQITVPVGTIITSDNGELLADLASPGDHVVVARGGRGGRGNASFASARRRVPGFGELGEPGEERWLRLELRLIADVAVIGFPNAGKSTLVRSLSSAKPKVGDYPFTTLEPSLGVVDVGDQRFTICDIPGLIEGAAEGKGLGLKFLRHAERAGVFLHLIDLASGRDPLNDYEVVGRELERYRADLAERTKLVALNKVDVVGEDVAAQAAAAFDAAGVETHVISAETRHGLDDLREILMRAVVLEREAMTLRSGGFELFRSDTQPIEVRREGEAWRVSGGSTLRWVAMTDMNNAEAVSYLQDRLERAGVEKALVKAGANEGDEVIIGDVTFEWWPVHKL